MLIMDHRKCIFITGAASGIGLETARLFTAKGWFVGISDVNEAGLQSLRNEIGENNCVASVMDVTDVESVRHGVDTFAGKTDGRMDVLFNNAGIVKFGNFDSVSILDHNRIVDVNLKGMLNCTHCALDYLTHTPGARIISMASTSAIYGVPDLSVYSATKHAVRAMTEAWDIELEKYGVTVSDILVPYVNTPLLNVPENVYSIQKMGVDLQPRAVAETVWKAAHGKKLHWKMGASTYLLMALFWMVPFVRRPVVKMLTVPPQRR